SFSSFGNNNFPVRALRLANVDGDYFSARRVDIGLDPEDWSIVVDQVVSGVKVVQQLYYGRILNGEILVVETRLNICAFAYDNDQIFSIKSSAATEEPLFLVRTFINQRVFRL